MEIKIEQRNNAQIFHLAGRFNIDGAEKLKKEAKQFAHEKKVNWVFDLSDVKFMDSAGIVALVASFRMVSKNGGDIKLASPQDDVRGILELTRLHRLFEIYSCIEDAVNSFKN